MATILRLMHLVYQVVDGIWKSGEFSITMRLILTCRYLYDGLRDIAAD